MNSKLSRKDRDLINRLQDDLPAASRPFAKIAEELNLTETEVVKRINELLDNGTLTRFGPFFDAQAMGGAFCLCAMKVPDDRFDEVADAVNRLPEVAHNYERDHQLNMWFILATESLSEIDETAKMIETETGLQVFQFPKEQEYYVRFRVNA